jgi:hypothetical protein
MEFKVIGHVVSKQRAPGLGGQDQLRFVAQALSSQFVDTDHVELAQAQSNGQTFMHVLIKVEPNEKAGVRGLGCHLALG